MALVERFEDHAVCADLEECAAHQGGIAKHVVLSVQVIERDERKAALPRQCNCLATFFQNGQITALS